MCKLVFCGFHCGNVYRNHFLLYKPLNKLNIFFHLFVQVFAKYKDGTEFTDWFNTVVFAIGRDAETKKIGLENAGVQTNPKTGKVSFLAL